MRAFGLAILVSCIVVFGACAQTRSVKTKVYEDRRTGVSLGKTVDRDGVPFAEGHSHPANLEVNDLKYLLRSIQYQEKGLFGWSEAKNVFSANELYRMGPYVVEAFSRATPDEEVLFHLTTGKQGSLFASDRFTNGKLYLKGNNLHCIFSNVNARPDVSGVYDGAPENFYAGVYWKLQPPEWGRLVEGVKGTHYNWIELDIKRGLEERKQREEAFRRRIRRSKTIKLRKQRENAEWEDWTPDEALENGPLEQGK